MLSSCSRLSSWRIKNAFTRFRQVVEESYGKSRYERKHHSGERVAGTVKLLKLRECVLRLVGFPPPPASVEADVIGSSPSLSLSSSFLLFPHPLSCICLHSAITLHTVCSVLTHAIIIPFAFGPRSSNVSFVSIVFVIHYFAVLV